MAAALPTTDTILLAIGSTTLCQSQRSHLGVSRALYPHLREMRGRSALLTLPNYVLRDTLLSSSCSA